MMRSKLKLIHHKHSGRHRAHEHTSYLPLALLVLMVGGVLASSSIAIVAAGSPPPQAGSIGLTGTLTAPPPKVAATITTPVSQQHFSTSPVTVAGTCPDSTLVEIYKNDIFAGSTPCTNGKYSLDVDLLYGQNSLTAQVYDVLDQAGPTSDATVVFYDGVLPQTSPLSSLNFVGTQLLLETNAVYRGSFPGQTLNVPISILGGTAPYAVNVEWGDSSNKIIPRSDGSVFNASHVYKKPGTYKITLMGTDSQQQVAYLTVAAIINGQPSIITTANTISSSNSGAGKLLVLWPLYAIAVTLVVSFWLGERREKHILLDQEAKQLPSLGVTPHAPTA